ncbi:MAG: hypothetical protein GJU72_13005 [Acidithiobacillus ferriphilus]|jgi:hypothetical protein|uniref:hypothetical protein n=1 Tax=Acidithiobacillus ferriphilus TaxID=1689834 RepID=UPI00242FC1C1|nr:hypothetical protein [Acidithiobacillus ferriphilus]MBW9249953.1 hypothetical protein [Acidithiobacillus ferriphilus]MBW9255443.1 hypothetical protein [Acidithiobacillus ferriphilus]
MSTITLTDGGWRMADGGWRTEWLTLLTPPANEESLLSESALAEDWLKPEEDAAWAYLQPVRSPLPSYAETAGDG